MIELTSRHNQNVAVLGLGRSGLAALRALNASGAQVTAWDDNAVARKAAEASGITIKDLSSTDFTGMNALITAPGIPFTVNPHPAIVRAQEARCPVIGDIELLAENAGAAKMVGITGTNGKSTTTALLAHLLETAKLPCQAGGNLGPPVLEFNPPKDGETLVLELSSFQLDLTHRATFDIAVLINISPDHLDRHGTMEAYVAAKRRLFNMPRKKGGAIAVICVDDAATRRIYEEVTADGNWRVIPVSVAEPKPGGVYVKDGMLIDSMSGAAEPVCDISTIPTLRGRHNHQNAACAYAAARSAGASRESIIDGMATFPGLPHRLENVGALDGVTFINDSKATNVEAAKTALACFENIFWIAGGRGKGEDYRPLAEFAGHIAHAYLIGEEADAIGGALPESLDRTKADSLEEAARAAFSDARMAGAGGTVLLSPACASFDQFANFAARGDAFRDIANDIVGEAKR